MQLFYLISSAMINRLAYLQEPTFHIVFYHHERAFPIPHHGILYRVLWLRTNIFLYRLSSWYPPFCKSCFCRPLIFSPAVGLDFSASPTSVQSFSATSFLPQTASCNSV